MPTCNQGGFEILSQLKHIIFICALNRELYLSKEPTRWSVHKKIHHKSFLHYPLATRKSSLHKHVPELARLNYKFTLREGRDD